MRRIALFSCLYLTACNPSGASRSPESEAVSGDSASAEPERSAAFLTQLDEAAVGVENPELAELLRRHWAWHMEQSPVSSTELGVRDFNAVLASSGLAASEAAATKRREFLAQAQAIDTAGMSESDQLTQQLLIEQLRTRIGRASCKTAMWSVTSGDNPVEMMASLPDYHKVDSVQDGKDLIARYRHYPKMIATQVEDLKKGAAQGWYGNQEPVRRGLEMVKTALGQPVEKWPLLRPLGEEHPQWSPAETEAFRTELKKVVSQEIRPELEAWVEFVEAQILPKARDDQHVGLIHLPGGEACYQARIEHYTTTKMTAQELHELGHKEMKRINDEMRGLGKKLFRTRDLKKIITRLRTDKSLYFKTSEEVETFARDAMNEAKAKVPKYFGIVPKAECVVLPIPEYEAPYSVLGYSRDPAPDGSRPGQYFINTYKPQSSPRFEAMVLAVHESIPGHHLQTAIAIELPAVPSFRKHGGQTVFVEGWALYTERLGEEMGMYKNDLDRMGVLSFDAWRASRLVVDTGIHAMGWSRQQAVEYMTEHTALTPKNIDNEVLRYINSPGQALAYKVGQLTIVELREEAEATLGKDFDLRTFHDAVLGAGALTVATLQARVRAYIAEEKRKKAEKN